MSDASTDTDTIAVEAADTEEMVRNQRLRGLFEAKRDCRQIRRKAENAATTHTGDQDNPNRLRQNREDAATYYRNAIESYAREAETLFSLTEAGRQYWTTHDFGEVVVEPENPAPNYDFEAPTETVPVEGINTLFDVDNPITMEMDVYLEHQSMRHDGYKSKTMVVQHQIPFPVLDRIYATINGYLAEVGLDISLEVDNDDVAEVDYSDLI